MAATWWPSARMGTRPPRSPIARRRRARRSRTASSRRLLGPDQPVYGLQARGLDGGEPLQTRIEEMAASYLDEVRRVQPAGPDDSLGDCVGGLIAYEMARQLQSVGEEVGLLAMIEAYPIGRRVPVGLRMRGFARRVFGRSSTSRKN